MCDFEAFYEKMASKLPDNSVIAEVGIGDGYSALFLADRLQSMGKKFTLYMIDNMDYGGTEQLNTIINHMIQAGIKGIKIYPYASLVAASMFPADHFDFIFLDSSHLYPETKQEIKDWYPRLKEDGIMGGHDYNHYPEVRKSVDEVIPHRFTRHPLYYEKRTIRQTFQEEQILYIEQTDKDYGVWWFKKKFYLRFKE